MAGKATNRMAVTEPFVTQFQEEGSYAFGTTQGRTGADQLGEWWGKPYCGFHGKKQMLQNGQAKGCGLNDSYNSCP